MDKTTKRRALFLLGCIPTRLLITYIAYKYPQQTLHILGPLALVPAIGFFTIYLFGLRKTGPEVFGDKIWWNHLRPIHGSLWATFAVFALTPELKPHAWKVLLIDTLLGLIAFTVQNLKN